MLKIAIAATLIVVIGTGSAIAGITLTHAAFARSAAINGKLIEQGSGIALEVDTGVKRGALNLPFDAAKLKSHVGREVILGLRPERITDVRHAHNGDASHLQPFDVRVDVTEPTGPDTHVFAQVNGKRIVSRVHPAANPQPDQTLSLLFDVSKAVLFDPASEERIA